MTLLLLTLLQDWKAGTAAEKITPEEPVFLAGYASRNKPFTGVAGDLWAKALALEDATGAKAVLITSDLLGLPAEVAEAVAARIGLPRERILLSSSHTHTGPALSPRDGRPENVAYTKVLQDKLVKVAEDALKSLAPATLSWGLGMSNIPMNRREFTPRGVILGVNARGPVDRSVPVLRVDGGAKVLLFQCACHCTTCTGEIYEVTGDYAGFAQDHIQKELPGTRAMFMAGCGGDANPYPRGTVELAKEHGASLGREVLRVAAGKLQPVKGPLSAAFGHAELPFESAKPLEELKTLSKTGPSAQRGVFAAQAALLEKGEKLPAHYRAPLGVWQFGDDLTLVALSGEVVVDYVFRLEKALGPLKLWVAAYCNDVYGYLPSARVLEEGGYETRGTYYGAPGIFAPTAESVLVDKVKELAGQAGRK
ncbi:MAG TPA: hypothetical protein VF950_18425 [Planctomycetota bacterium]